MNNGRLRLLEDGPLTLRDLQTGAKKTMENQK